MELESTTERMYYFSACVLLAGLISHSEETLMYRKEVCFLCFWASLRHTVTPGMAQSLTSRNRRSFKESCVTERQLFSCLLCSLINFW